MAGHSARLPRAAAILGLLLLALSAQAVELRGLRFPIHNEHHTQVILELDAPLPASHRFRPAPDSPDWVLELPGTHLAVAVEKLLPGPGFVRAIQPQNIQGEPLQLRFVLGSEARVKSFSCRGQDRLATHLELDLSAASSDSLSVHRVPARREPKVVIMLDAGHGGADCGTTTPEWRGKTCPRSTDDMRVEKNVVLDVVRRMESQLKQIRGFRVMLTRDGDQKVHLSQRRALAEKAQVDLFVSVHADGYYHSRARGASVFVFSPEGVEKAAKERSVRANGADAECLGRARLASEKPYVWEGVYGHLMSEQRPESMAIAEKMLEQLGRIGALHGDGQEYNEYRVLKAIDPMEAPQVLSVLVELAFMTNPEEARKLADARHRERLAQALVYSITEYFAAFPPEGTWLAGMQPQQTLYTVKEGDTLFAIAARYGSSVAQLQAHNRLSDPQSIHPGDLLFIPPPARQAAP